MGLRHIVLLSLDERCDVDGLVDALRALPPVIPELRRYEVGVDAGLSEGNATLAVLAEFDDAAGWAAYRDHPQHVQVVAERIRPHLAQRLAVQHPF
jgi:hypothetical protein